MEEDPVIRPNVLQWLRYVYVGSVPRKNSAWVLYDATCPTWVLRHAARYLVLITPLLVGVMFLPTTLGIRLGACFSAGASILIGYLCFTTESLERRIEKAGYTWGLAGQMRERRAIAAQNAAAARNRARREGRLQQRRGA
jgi:Family of unknown function (DUF5313)